MKIVVKSTKTISFDENYEDDDSSGHEDHDDDDEDQNNSEIDALDDQYDKSMGTVSGPENCTSNPTSEKFKDSYVNSFIG